jgi:hypothetical protein
MILIYYKVFAFLDFFKIYTYTYYNIYLTHVNLRARARKKLFMYFSIISDLLL